MQGVKVCWTNKYIIYITWKCLIRRKNLTIWTILRTYIYLVEQDGFLSVLLTVNSMIPQLPKAFGLIQNFIQL